MTSNFTPTAMSDRRLEQNITQLLALLRSEVFHIDDASGQVSIGTRAPDSESALQIDSTTGVFLPPRMTTTQRDALSAPPAGGIIFNTTDSKHQGWDGSAWNNLY